MKIPWNFKSQKSKNQIGSFPRVELKAESKLEFSSLVPPFRGVPFFSLSGSPILEMGEGRGKHGRKTTCGFENSSVELSLMCV